MTVTTTATYSQAVGNGVATAFPFTFGAASADEVRVSVNSVELTGGFTVTLSAAGTGGTVTFDTAPANLAAIVIESDPDFTQETQFANEGDFQPATFDRVHDRFAVYAQWLRERVAAIFPSTLSILPAARAGKYLGFDADGVGALLSGSGADAALRTDLAAGTGAALSGFLQTGTSAVTRSLAARAQDDLKAKDFGILANGSDETIKLTAAVTEAIASGRALLLPAGSLGVSSLPIALTAAAASSGFEMRGQGATKTKFVQLSGASPIINLSHATVPQTANVVLAGFGVYGLGNTAPGIRNTAAASAFLDKLWIQNCTTGIDLVGAICNEISRTFVTACGTGVKLSKSGGAYANANQIVGCRINGNTVFGIDFGQGAQLIVDRTNIELNGTSGNTGTGGIMIRATVDDEIGYGSLAIRNSWLESNYGRSIQAEALAAGSTRILIDAVRILSAESGRAIYGAGGAIWQLSNVEAPTVGDTFDITAQMLSVTNSICSVLSGTQTFFSASNFLVGGAAISAFKNMGGSFELSGTYAAPLIIRGNYVWVDVTGKLRIKATAPASDTDGTVVGTQT